MNYEFTNKWFEGSRCKQTWPIILQEWTPSKILEIGSFEGASASFIIENNTWSDIKLYCIDTWEGGIEHKRINMRSVEDRFDRNIKIAKSKSKFNVDIIKKKAESSKSLVELLHTGHAGSFDFIYIDGSHIAADVLLDSLLSFKLLRIGGVMIFDDYLYSPDDRNMINTPKLGIDAFTTTHFNKINILPFPFPPLQVFVKKISE